MIGYLGSTSPGPYLAAYRQGLGEMGYVEGQNVAIEYRWVEGRYDRLPALAAELVAAKVDVIVSTGGSTGALVGHEPRWLLGAARGLHRIRNVTFPRKGEPSFVNRPCLTVSVSLPL